MSIDAEIDALAARAVDGLEDVGAARLAKAHVRRSYAEAIVRQVCARHGVTQKAVLGKRRLHHLVMARAQIAAVLYEGGYSFPQIAALLGWSHHSQAMRNRQLWLDHRAGLLERVTEAEGRKALILMRRNGWSAAEAARSMGVSPVKLKGRISTIRAKEKDQ